MRAALSRLAEDVLTRTAAHYVFVTGLYALIIVVAVTSVATEL